MKKSFHYILILIFSLPVMLFSCATTENIPENTQTESTALKESADSAATEEKETPPETDGNSENNTEEISQEQQEMLPQEKISDDEILPKFVELKEEPPAESENTENDNASVTEENIPEIPQTVAEETEELLVTESEILLPSAEYTQPDENNTENQTETAVLQDFSDSSISQNDSSFTQNDENLSETKVSLAPDTTETTENAETNSETEITTNENIENIENSGEENTPEQEALQEKIIPSRSMTVKNNQFIDVNYPGSGWVFTGETNEDGATVEQPLFTYFGRKLGTADTSFSLRSKRPGTTILHFYKNDVLTSSYIDDYLQVTVENENAKPNTRTTAPDYAETVPPKPVRRKIPENTQTEDHAEITPADHADTEIENTTHSANMEEKNTEDAVTENGTQESYGNTSEPQKENTEAGEVVKEEKTAVLENTTQEPEISETVLFSDDLLEKAKKSYSDGEFETALTQIKNYIAYGKSGIDEALFIQGQAAEANSPARDIKLAIQSYRTLTENYPSSRFWNEANRRLIQLERFYINIR